MKTLLSTIAGLLVILAFVPYGRAIVKKQTKPMKSSWIIWAVLDSITFAGMYAEGAVNGQILGAVIGVWVIVFLALRHGESGWSRLDKTCMAGAAVGIAIWQVFNSPILGVMTSLSILFLGAVPTFASAWRDPSREDRKAWVIFWLSCVFAVAAIPQWTLADAAQPLVFFAINSIMMAILFSKR